MNSILTSGRLGFTLRQSVILGLVASLGLMALGCGGNNPTEPLPGKSLDGEQLPAELKSQPPPGDRNSMSVGIPLDPRLPLPAGTITAGRILVKFSANTTQLQSAGVHAQLGGTYLRTLTRIAVQVVEVPAGEELAMVAAYAHEATVLYAEPVYVVKAAYTPNDPRYLDGSQYHIKKVSADKAWDVTKGKSSVKVAVLDTGYDTDHPDLASKVVGYANRVSGSTIEDKNGHGTHVAGIIAATTNNAKQVAGVGFNTSLLICKVLGNDGYGTTDVLIDGIEWAVNNGAKVINMSLGNYDFSNAEEDAVNDAYRAGVVLVAAAGNDSVSDKAYPAAYGNVIAVGATDSADKRYYFTEKVTIPFLGEVTLTQGSNYGSWVDVCAPGVYITSTTKDGYYGVKTGTSMASPVVAGEAALLWATSAYGTSNMLVRERILTKVDYISTDKAIGGRVNVYNAVK